MTLYEFIGMNELRRAEAVWNEKLFFIFSKLELQPNFES